MGGMSAEREISLMSGKAVYNALVQNGYHAVAIDVGKDVYNKIIREKIAVAFIALHGKYGEDGAIQGLLEVMGIPYTGSGILASAIAINKILTKQLLMLNKISTPEFEVVKKGDSIGNALFERLGTPLIVKPNSQGSTIGVSLVNGRRQIKRAIKKALKYDDTILVERFIKGREMHVSVLSGRALPIVEVRPKNEIYDFKAKYTKGMTEYIVPAKLPKGLHEKLTGIALRAFAAIGCSGAARLDMMLDNKNRPYVLEMNTIPGMTEMSLLPKAAAAAGIGFSAMVEEILLGAPHRVKIWRTA
ncbi:MAG: D-alanine--D-alanine ligase [Deltaproteobacteria bacterium]|nr:D-alanine--D-alanine ligase [Deltaproteobacteria bacterium]